MAELTAMDLDPVHHDRQAARHLAHVEEHPAEGDPYRADLRVALAQAHATLALSLRQRRRPDWTSRTTVDNGEVSLARLIDGNYRLTVQTDPDGSTVSHVLTEAEWRLLVQANPPPEEHP